MFVGNSFIGLQNTWKKPCYDRLESVIQFKILEHSIQPALVKTFWIA